MLFPLLTSATLTMGEHTSPKANLSEQKRDHVCGLPVGGVEEMRQGHRGEGRQGVRAVQGVVYPLAAPPPGGDWSEEGEMRWERTVRRLIAEVLEAAGSAANT